MSKIKNGSLLDEELSNRQIAELVNVHYNTVPKLLERGKIKSNKLKDVIEYIKEVTIIEYEKENV